MHSWRKIAPDTASLKLVPPENSIFKTIQNNFTKTLPEIRLNCSSAVKLPRKVPLFSKFCSCVFACFKAISTCDSSMSQIDTL